MRGGKHRNGNCGRTQSADATACAANNLNPYFIITNSAFSASPREIRPTYDLNGNLTYDGTNAYFWDLQNQLILVSNAEVQVASAYDAMGRRVKKIVSRRDAETQSWGVEKTCHFFYDGWNLVRETVQLNSLTQPNALTNCYVWGNDLSGSLQGAGGVGGLLAVSCVSSSTSYLSPLTSYPLYDHNGNVERYVSRNGVTVAAFQYDAFGNTVSETFTQSGTNAFTNFRFSTKYWDAETGLYYYGYRFYRPELGRWVNRDPIGENGGVNLYVVVHNRPIDRRDPFGLTNDPGDFGWEWYNPNFFPPPPDPSIARPRLGDFHHHGNWGGPGWAAGGWNPEASLKASDFDDDRYTPIDDRDWCYWGHDKCIWKCHQDPCNNNDEKLKKCIRPCDYTLAGCLYKLPRYKPSFYVTSEGLPVRGDIEAVLFLEHIPFLVHGGWQTLF